LAYFGCLSCSLLKRSVRPRVRTFGCEYICHSLVESCRGRTVQGNSCILTSEFPLIPTLTPVSSSPCGLAVLRDRPGPEMKRCWQRKVPPPVGELCRTCVLAGRVQPLVAPISPTFFVSRSFDPVWSLRHLLPQLARRCGLASIATCVGCLALRTTTRARGTALSRPAVRTKRLQVRATRTSSLRRE